MADPKGKRRMLGPEPWADRAEWMDRDESIRARKRLYGSTRIRMIPKQDPEDSGSSGDMPQEPPSNPLTKEDGNG